MVMAPVASWVETVNTLAQGRLRCLVGFVLRPWRLRCTDQLRVRKPGSSLFRSVFHLDPTEQIQDAWKCIMVRLSAG